MEKRKVNEVKDLEGEIWVDVPNYEGLYQVSNFGNVKSLSRYVGTSDKLGGRRKTKERLLKLWACKGGYLMVRLSRGCSIKNFFVHRLVAIAFIPNPHNLPQINHKDENPSNNTVNNLEWCDAKYNNNYGGRIKKAAAATSKPVKQYDMQGNFIRDFCSLTEAWDSVGVRFCHEDCVEGKSVGGYQWRMDDKPCGMYAGKRGRASKSRIKIIAPNGSDSFFEGYVDAAKFLGVSTSLFCCIICGNRRGKKLCGYTIELTKVSGEVKTIKI